MNSLKEKLRDLHNEFVQCKGALDVVNQMSNTGDACAVIDCIYYRFEKAVDEMEETISNIKENNGQ